MKKLFFITALVIMLFPMIGHAAVIDNVRGYILLQVEENGEAWYVNPADNSKYYMKDGGVAYQMMRNFGLGITDIDLNKIPSVSDTTEMKNLSSICSSNSLANRLKGKILLQVQQHGEAWYIYPKTCRKIYMKDGEAAYSIMRFLGLGITNQNLNLIKSGAQVDIPETVATTNTTYSPTTSCPSNQLFYEPYNRCISYDESCNIKYQNSYLGETNTDGSYICYCDIGYEWAYPINTSGNYCKKIENLDNDNDGIPNEYDLHPNGGDVIKNKILEYVDDDNQMIYNFQVDIPYDWYHYYVNYKTHNFTSNFTNITDFVTPEAPPIKQLVGKFADAEQQNPNFNFISASFYIVRNNFYLDDANTGFDEYPKYPIETIMEGTSDCEDTSFLLASILQSFKNLSNNSYAHIALIRFPNHLAVGVGLDPTEDNNLRNSNPNWDPAYYEVDGIKYYYIETTSDDFGLGELPTELIGQTAYVYKID